LITARQRLDVVTSELRKRRAFLAFSRFAENETPESLKNDSASITR
jgi:hypothetical protein